MRGAYQRVGPGRIKVSPGQPVPTAPAPVTKPNGRQRVIRPWKSPAQLTFYVHAHGPTVRDNKSTGLNRSLVLLRRSDRLHEMVIARHVELPGPSKLVHRHDMPLPETENNAIAVMETTERPIAYFDPPTPPGLIAFATDVPLESCTKVVLTDEEWAKRAIRATHQIRR